MAKQEKNDCPMLDDRQLAALFSRGDAAAVQLVTGRNNQRLFRVAWSILKNRSEAEDVVQSTYLRAFTAIGAYQGRASLSTWLTRIAINEAIERRRKSARSSEKLDLGSVIDLQEYRDKLMKGSANGTEPDRETARAQVRRILEAAVARLPAMFRTVFVLREIEQMSVEEVSMVLGIPPATVKTRCLRARLRLQKELAPEIKQTLAGSFPFAGADCAAMTERVLKHFSRQGEGTPPRAGNEEGPA